MVRFAELHDLFATSGGGRISAPGEWSELSESRLERLVDLVYGGMPPVPSRVEVTLRAQSRLRRLQGEPVVSVYRVSADVAGQPFDLGMQVITPRVEEEAPGTAIHAGVTSNGPSPLPVVIDSDACWWNLDDVSIARFLGRGIAMVRFDRTEVVDDPGATPGSRPPRRGGLYDRYRDGGFGAVAAWAWGIHRVIDALHVLEAGHVSAGPQGSVPLDTTRIAVSGFSRGGKAVLLAGATDPRIGLVHAHASGAGGAAPFLIAGEGSEGMCVASNYPGWFGQRLSAYVDREAELPMDQHALVAAVLPRPLLLTLGVDDLWTDPAGTAQAALAAGEVARFLGRPDAIEMRVRPGGHYRVPEDWAELLRFVAHHWLGVDEPTAWRDATLGLEPAFDWRAPVV